MGNAIVLRSLCLACAVALGGCSVGPAPQQKRAGITIRHQVDQSRSRVWLLTRAGIVVFDVAAPYPVRRVVLPGWAWLGDPSGCLPDLALGPDGEAVVSSDVAPEFWRVDAETLEVSRHRPALDAGGRKQVGFSGLEYSAEQAAYLGAGTRGGLWRIDPGLAQAKLVAPEAPPSKGCDADAQLPQGIVYRR